MDNTVGGPMWREQWDSWSGPADMEFRSFLAANDKDLKAQV